MAPKRRSALLFITALVCAICAISTIGAVTKSAFEGDWGVNLPDYGWIALRVQSAVGRNSEETDLWWLVEHSFASLRTDLDNQTLVLSRVGPAKTSEVVLRMKLDEQGKLQLLPGGVLPDPVPAPFDALRLDSLSPDAWADLVLQNRPASEWNKWHHIESPSENSQFSVKPLPSGWPASVVETSVRLVRDNDALLSRWLELPVTPPALLSEAYGWTLEKSDHYRDHYLIRRTIAAHPHCDSVTLEKIWLTENDALAWRAAMFNPKAKPEWRKLYLSRVSNGPEQVKTSAAGDSKAPPEIFTILLPDSPRVRGALAYNRGLPPALFEELASRYVEEVGLNLAENPATPASAISLLAKSSNRAVQYSVSKHPKVSPETRIALLTHLANTAKGMEANTYASEVSLPAEVLDNFASSFDPQVRTKVAANPATSMKSLIRIARDDFVGPAKTARDALRKRYPEEYARLAPNLRPIERLDSNTYYWQGKLWASALAAGALSNLERIVDYFAETRELGDLVERTAADLAGTFRPQIMDLILAKKYILGRSLGKLIATAAGNADWLAYFKDRNAWSGRTAYFVYENALSSRDPNLLPALIKAGPDVNQQGDYGMTPLHLATRSRKLDAVRQLIDAGARADIPDDRRQTALDYAVQGKFIPAVLLLDREGKYTALVDQFTKEFPPVSDSPFLGRWTNGKDGFSTLVIRLDPNGTGIFAAVVASGLIAWRPTSETEAVAYFFDGKGEPDRTKPLRFKLGDNQQMTLEIDGAKETESMRRDKK